MGARLKVVPDPLFAGFYSISEAARLLGLDSTSKVSGWINGWTGSKSEPIIKRDFQNSRTISFLDLMEVRFILHFRQQGVPLQTLRKAAERMRRDWKTEHPFALSKVQYLTDRKKIFAQIAKENSDRVTWDMATGQHEMWETVEAVIEMNVRFDPKTALALVWTPLPEFENVIVDPRVAFGKPSVEGHSVPTSALFRQWKAEKSFEKAGRLFNVDPQTVETAVRFEIAIAA